MDEVTNELRELNENVNEGNRILSELTLSIRKKNLQRTKGQKTLRGDKAKLRRTNRSGYRSQTYPTFHECGIVFHI